jgi:hypothetical protein
MPPVGTFATVLLALAVLLLLAAEWPRIAARFGGDARASRARSRRKGRLTVIEGQAEAEDDDFAASVERDLANLPVIEERDDRSRR